MCTIRGVIISGIILAVFDIIHGLVTAGFYVYNLIMHNFYICPQDTYIDICRSKIYVFDQMFETRVYIGIGEGIAGVFFAIIYILALVKHKPSLTWIWLMKAFAVISINIYYLAWWILRQGQYELINKQSEEENMFIYAAEALTGMQVFIVIMFCIIGGLFTYKVVEERTASRRSLRARRYMSASAPPIEYEDEEAHFLNDHLTNSDKTIQVKASKNSLVDLSRAETFKQSTGV